MNIKNNRTDVKTKNCYEIHTHFVNKPFLKKSMLYVQRDIEFGL